MIPKTEYIKKICEDAAKNGTITTDYIFDILMRNLWVTTIHDDENKLLGKVGITKQDA